MDDFTGLGKLAEGLSKPAVKFIEVVSDGIGALYEPVAIRRRGEAEAQQLITIETAKARAEELRKDIQLAGHLGRLQSLVDQDPNLLQRTTARLARQEIQGQVNVEAIADAAMKLLPDQVSEEPVDDDWKQRFFKLAADISSEDMRGLWAKILAGEVTRPKAYGVRTLETLHAMSQSEASLFAKFVNLCPIAPFNGVVPLNDFNYGLAQYGITFEDVLVLREVGVVTPDMVAIRYEADQATAFIFNDRFRWWIKTKNRVDTKYISLSVTGRELMTVTGRESNEKYIGEVVEKLKGQGYEMKAI